MNKMAGVSKPVLYGPDCDCLLDVGAIINPGGQGTVYVRSLADAPEMVPGIEIFHAVGGAECNLALI